MTGLFGISKNSIFHSDCMGTSPIDRKYYVSGQDINPATGKAYAINPASGAWDDNYFAANFGGGKGGSGGGTPRLDFVKGLTDQMMASDAAEKAKVDSARSDLISYYKGLPNSVDLFKQYNEDYGVTAQQKLVDALTKDTMQQQDMYEAIPASVVARSGDFLINDADKTAITAREQKPVLENLNKLLRNKQYEEVGLAGKQALVSQLLQLTLQDQEKGAKPYELGVDFTTEDRQIAKDLFTTVLSSQSSAFSGDQDSADADRRAAEQRAFEEAMQERSFAQQTSMENLSSKNSLSNSLALKEYDTAHKSSGGGSNGAPNDNPIYKGLSKEQVKQVQQKTDDAWNKILASSKTEYDAWKKINANQKTLANQGVDVQQLWSNHSALAAKVGTGGSIRKSSDDL